MKKYFVSGVFVASLILLNGCSNQGTSNDSTASTQQTTKKIQIVAAENFYGDIAKQLAGNHADVVSILSDPNVDPHEYESTVQDGIHISDADIVIYNGLDYDTWMEKLIEATPSPNRTVISAASIATDILKDNPHLWYGVDNMLPIAQNIHDTLVEKDPADIADFDQNLGNFKDSIFQIQQKMADIKKQFNGTPIALTETVELYQTKVMGLNVLTPIEFENAVAEGNDPSAQDVKTTNDQINNKAVKILIYNSQTVTPITTNLQDAAKKQTIPQVYVTETMPANVNYQTWMMNQLNALQQGLQSVIQ